MTHSALFLVTVKHPQNDNHQRLPRYLERAGWQVHLETHENLTYTDNTVCAAGAALNQFDLIWPVGFGPARTFADRTQLLSLVDQNRLINPVTSYHTLHGKTAWLRYGSKSLVSQALADFQSLFADQPGKWVLKPVAGSFGSDVYRVDQPQDIAAILKRRPNEYWLMQKFLDDIHQGECRTLMCAGEILGSYLRIPSDGLHANLATHATVAKVVLSAAQEKLLAKVHSDLETHNIGFAAVDMVGDQLMEVNLANPGGIATLAELYENEDTLESQVVAALERRFTQPG